jgi:hypothetical protein
VGALPVTGRGEREEGRLGRVVKASGGFYRARDAGLATSCL